MISQRSTRFTTLALGSLVSLCLACVAVASAVAGGTGKPGDRGSEADVANVLAARVAKGPTAALVTVRYADLVGGLPWQKGSAAIVADARQYANRKQQALAVTGVSKLDDYPLLPVVLVRIANPAALRDLGASDEVVSVQPDRRNQADLAQSLPLIHQPEVAAAGDKGAGTAVAVLDTGVDFHRAAFGSCTHVGDPGCAVAYAHDFAPDDSSVDDNGHGTNVAGIALGVAPATKILALDVFEGSGAYDSDVVAAVEWAVGNRSTYNIRALNLSLGNLEHNTSECTWSSYSGPFEVARAAGIVPVVAAGNYAYVEGEYEDGVSAPACASGALSVGAVYDSSMGSRGWGGSPYHCSDASTAADKITCFSQSGPLLSLLAPGAEITAAGITESGTSQATPHVAGAVAVLGAVKPQASSYKVQQSLASTGPTIFDPRSGILRHRLDLATAVADLRQPDAVIEDAGCGESTLLANDDGSTGVVNLPFTVNFFGTQYAEAYVNNNGNITFEAPLGTYTPFYITSVTPPIIAPFFADVDTRPVGSREVTYGVTSYGDRPAFCVNWVDVGYFGDHIDKTNSFQLLLVDRSNVGSGDFDVIMNYDRVLWETGDASDGVNGFGGTPAAAGYSAGDGEPDHFFAFPGSISSGAFLDGDPGGLIHGSRGSQQPGRYIFPIRNGLAPGSAGLEGAVEGPGGVPLNQAPVQACILNGQCVTTRTGTDGRYSLAALPPGDYEVTAFPPSGSDLSPAGPVAVTLADGLVSTVDLLLSGPTPPPPGTTITDRGTTEGGIPVLYWNDPLTLQTQACAGGSVNYRMILEGSVIRSGQMTETPPGSGHYVAGIAPLYPDHGPAVISIESTCPNSGDDGHVDFDVYIDPSGVVVDRYGDPIGGAIVTLLRSDTSDGPFEVLPNESPEMSPSNRNNPDTTAVDGSFGWDVIAGYYEVHATKSGCASTDDPAVDFASSGVLTIPPPVTNLVLTLDCADRLSVALEGGGSGSVSSDPAGISCSGTCDHKFPNGAQVTLVPHPASGSTFAGWSGGGCSGTSPCAIALHSDTKVTATFSAVAGGGSPLAGGGTSASSAGGSGGPSSKGTTKPRSCRKGFVKRKVHGKPRCVRRGHKKHRQGRHGR
jgi:hypothetical protein